MTRTYTNIPYTEYITADGRFDKTRATIDKIVLHTTVATAQAAMNLFGNTPAVGKETSAHYIVDTDGKLWAGLEEYYTAYHAGNYAFNQRSIGIEHADNGNYNSPRPDALYATSAKLVADICKYYNIPCNNTNIVRHQNVPGSATACPDSLDTDRIIRDANAILGGTTPTPPTDDCAVKLTSMTAERDRLNTIIGTVKDPQIADLTKQLADLKAKDANYEAIVSEKNGLAVNLSECQRTSIIYKAEYDASNAPTGYKAQISQLETDKKNLSIDVTKQKTLASYWETKFNNTKKPVQKLIIAIAEKLGIQI